MGKLLFWIVIIIGALVIARIAARSAAQGRPPAGRTRRGPDLPPETMVRCAHCGIHLPAAEAVRRKGYNYCTLAHSLRGRRS